MYTQCCLLPYNRHLKYTRCCEQRVIICYQAHVVPEPAKSPLNQCYVSTRSKVHDCYFARFSNKVIIALGFSHVQVLRCWPCIVEMQSLHGLEGGKEWYFTRRKWAQVLIFLKFNMEPKDDGFQNESPIPGAQFQGQTVVYCLISWRSCPHRDHAG